MSNLHQRVMRVRERMEGALRGSDRELSSVLLVLATKTRQSQEIREAVEYARGSGLRVAVAENRAQEIAKHAELDDLHRDGVQRHFLGRLQTNKARDVVAFADLIHSVDRLDLITALARRAEQRGQVQPILVQVKTSAEETKAGFAPEVRQVREAVEAARATGWLEVQGLMTIGSHTPERTAVRASLRRLRELRDELADPQVRELSMGMSTDLEIALAEGATMVRVGSAIFGPRPT